MIDVKSSGSELGFMEGFESTKLSRMQMFSFFLITGLVVGAAGTYLLIDSDGVPKQEVGQQVVTTVEAQTGQDFEIINVKTENGLYRVDVSNSEDELSTSYVTKDGALITDSVADFQQTRELAVARRQLSNCLGEREVVMFGNASQQETRAQIQLLGGENYISGIYADVSNQEVLMQARRLGVSVVPAFYHNGSVSEGVTRPSALANFTGCRYGTGNY